MPDWKYSIDISEVYQQLHEKKIKIQYGASVIYLHLKPLSQSINSLVFDDIVAEFMDLSLSTDGTVEDFDSIMKQLYDFGDRDNTLWICTTRNLKNDTGRS